MFEDFRSVPPLLAVLWTAIMFWGGLAWLIYAVIMNNQLKVAKALEFGTSDFNNIPTAIHASISKKSVRNDSGRHLSYGLKV